MFGVAGRRAIKSRALLRNAPMIASITPPMPCPSAGSWHHGT